MAQFSMLFTTSPTNEHDLMISASKSWVLAYDNLSKISANTSDAFCRLSTGGGFATRKLYTDNEEQVFNVKRPMILNGINDIASRSDLLDRCITLTLPPIQMANRRSEEDFLLKFNESKPRILGALLDAVSTALSNYSTTNLKETPRMADFAKWAVAAEPALGVPAGTFMKAYIGHRQAQDAEIIATSPIGPAIQKLLNQKPTWSGTAQDLLKDLSTHIIGSWTEQSRLDWPKTPKAMAGALRRIAPNFRNLGFDVEFIGKSGHDGSRIIRLNKAGQQSPASPAQPAKVLKAKVCRQNYKFPLRAVETGISSAKPLRINTDSMTFGQQTQRSKNVK